MRKLGQFIVPDAPDTALMPIAAVTLVSEIPFTIVVIVQRVEVYLWMCPKNVRLNRVGL